MKCSICKQEGHNKRYCETAKLDTPIVENTFRKTYETTIRNHENYDFLPKEQKKNWVSVSKKGQNSRKPYWDVKQKDLIDLGEIPKESSLVNLARHIHPTKKHVCKKCETECSIYYEYPTANTWKWLDKTFGYKKNDDMQHLTIFDIYAKLTDPSKNDHFKKYFGLTISDLEIQCKSDKYSGNKLSPGVMGNPPDRLDGFHCYNSVCSCRVKNDKGRSIENMKSYGRDRRAYEYFSDGNCLLANAVMGQVNTITNTCFVCNELTLMTADHIGPISLGFIHDPLNFQACCKGCNSRKNNRITKMDVEKIKLIEEKGGCVASWWAKDAWEGNKDKSIRILQANMDKNTKKFLSVILWLKMNKLDILESFVKEVYMNHTNSYIVTNTEILSSGDIKFSYTESVTGKKTKDTQKERTKQILMELNEKTNRKIKIKLSEEETSYLSNITVENFKSKICKVLVGL
jgi:Alw26I/Eco31I/Esp3I family type II restriction endonuclease